EGYVSVLMALGTPPEESTDTGALQLLLAGLVEVTIPPLPSTATQRIVDGHDTASNCALSTSPSVQAGAPPVGSVECSSVPLASTTTHSVVLGQATPGSASPSATSADVQAEAPPVGL